MSAARLEYRIIDMNVMVGVLEDELNLAAADGWEFVCVYQHLPILSIIFKRVAAE